MRQLILILTASMALLLTLVLGEAACHDVSSHSLPPGEFKSQQTSVPVTDDYGLVFTAPAQVPLLCPTQSSRLVTPAKHRTTLSLRSNVLRRCANRLSDNIYTPLATTGQLVVERITSPLRYTHAVHFYVLVLCRLLC